MEKRRMTRYSPMRVAALAVTFLLTALVFLAPGGGAFAQIRAKKASAGNHRKTEVQKKETYTRPPLSRPVKPSIPTADRNRTDKVFLEHADSLFRPPFDFSGREKQIVKGTVKFRQAGMWLYCDSAYYFPEENSLDAFGNVRMQQGDTLFVFADKLFYNGDERRARLRCGPSQRQVKMENRDVTLLTDSFDYDLQAERGWYATGGRLDDKVNTLTSVYGEYSPATKEAEFYHDVLLVNNKDGYRLISDTLLYNTATHIADIVSRTVIEGANDTVLTSQGSYNTQTDYAELTSRSTIIHRDSDNNVTTLVGDSIIYDKATRISRAYMSRNPYRNPQPMVLTDTARKSILIGGFGMYNDSTREALATEYPLLMEFSRPDTLFLRADTIMTFIEVAPVTKDAPDSLSSSPDLQLHDDLQLAEPPLPKEYRVALAYNNARFFSQDAQGVADTIRFVELDTMLYLRKKPIIWSEERQVFGNRIDVHLNDSTVDWALLPDWGMMIEHVDEDFFNQLCGREMKALFKNGDLNHLDVTKNVQTIFLPMENDSTYNKMVKAESGFLSVDMEDRELKRLKMWPDVSGTVTPLFLVKKKEDKRLQYFDWQEAIRPRREWYGDRVRWADDLGELPEGLVEYLNAPSIFPQISSSPGMAE